MMSEAATRTALRVDSVSKTFMNRNAGVMALRDVSFTVDQGEFLSIVGPSGCGKSTLLNIIAGLEPHDSGEIMLSNPAASRLGQVAYMPQKDLLLPWRTVLENASLGLELTGVPSWEARERARHLLPRFGLDGFAGSYPAMLSGGMRQRAAFLRTILTDRDLLLLDEPFGALDALTRRSMQEWLLGIWSEVRRTVVLITHDVEEAIFLSDRVAVMSPRPGMVLMEQSVDLPRPRSPDIVTASRFVEIKREIMAALRSGVEASGNAIE